MAKQFTFTVTATIYNEKGNTTRAKALMDLKRWLSEYKYLDSLDRSIFKKLEIK